MKIFLYLFLLSVLHATVNDPLRWELFTGYRNDKIHWHIEDPAGEGNVNYSEIYRDVQYWLNGLALKVTHRDLHFFIKGAYGAFGKGKVTQRLHPESFRLDTDGWAADVSGYFGYAVNLTADRVYQVLLTPLIGYLGYFEVLKRHSIPGVFRLVWNGVFLGAQLHFENRGPLSLTAGYAYNFIHNRVHAGLENGKLKTSSGGNGGQTGWAQMDWNLISTWKIGIGGEIHYFTTRVVDATVEENSRADYEQKFKLRWTPVSGWGQISRAF